MLLSHDSRFLSSTFDAALAQAPTNEAIADVLAYLQADGSFMRLQQGAHQHNLDDLPEGFCAAVRQKRDKGVIPGLDENEAQQTVSWHHVVALYRTLTAESAAGQA